MINSLKFMQIAETVASIKMMNILKDANKTDNAMVH